jgi:outer membrane protein TolC
MMTWLLSVALAEEITADEVVAQALARDPALADAEARVTAAEGELRAASGLRDNPTVEGRLGFGVVQHEVAVSQPISVTGEGLRAHQAAQAALQAAQAERDRRRLEVATDARRGLVEAIRAEIQLALAREARELATSLRTAAEARLSSGDAPELEVHLARLEEAAAASDLIAATRRAREARETLAGRAGLSLQAELPTDPLAALPAEAEPNEVRSDVAAARARTEAASAQLARERAAALAPVEVGAWAQFQGGDVGWTAGPVLTVTLPLWHANPAGVAAAQAEQGVAEAALAAAQAEAEAERAGVADRREVIAIVSGVADPTAEARAALAGTGQAAAAGQIGVAEAAVLRSRVLNAWGRGAEARAEAALAGLDIALAEEWPTLLGSAP